MTDEAGTRTGTQLGPYAIGELLGRGGMGEVYLAHDDRRTRDVALKLLHPSVAEDPDFRERFTRESQTVARLADPHVIPIHDFGEIDGVLYLDMRLVQGRNLSEVLRAGPLSPDRAVEVIEQIAGALDAAHGQGLIHRDVKPANIEITSGGFPYLLDFGLAVTDTQSRMTSAGVFIGSQAYSAPERFDGTAATVAADVYALACVLYEALTGQPPYRAQNLTGMLGQHLNAPIPRPSAQVPVSSAMDAVIAHGLAKTPDGRFAHCGDLAAAARAALTSTAAEAAAGGVVLTKGDPNSTMIRPEEPAVIPAGGQSWPGAGSHPGPASTPGPNSGQRYPGRQQSGPRGGNAYPGQQYAGQQYPGQQYAGPQYAGQQYAAGYPPAARPRRTLVPVLGAAAAILVVVIGVLGYLVFAGGKDRSAAHTVARGDAPALTAPAVTAGAGATGSAATANPTTAAPLAPSEALPARADADRAVVLAQLNNRWVAQLSTKWPGLVADGRTWNDAAILAEVNSLQQRFGTVRLLWSTQWSVFSLPDVWVTVYGAPFAGPDAALTWCRQQGFDGEHCLAKFISTTAGTSGTTKTY